MGQPFRPVSKCRDATSRHARHSSRGSEKRVHAQHDAISRNGLIANRLFHRTQPGLRPFGHVPRLLLKPSQWLDHWDLDMKCHVGNRIARVIRLRASFLPNPKCPQNPAGQVGRVVAMSILLFVLTAGAVAEQRTKAISPGRLHPPFTLNETLLRRVDALLKARMDLQVKNGSNHFEVVHANNTAYETDSVDEVAQDVNSESNPITSLTITALGPFPSRADFEGLAPDELARILQRVLHDRVMDSRPTIDVKFNSDGLQFNVKGPDTGWVLASRFELEALLNLVARKNYGLPRLRPLVFPFVAFGLFYLVLRSARNRYDQKNASHTNLYNYLLDVRDPFWSNQPKRFGMLAIGSIAIALLSREGFAYLIDYLFPPAVFELGDETRVYAELLALRGDIFWVVIVGLPIAVIGALIATRVASGRTDNPGSSASPESQRPL
jgi:hypothetical protein